MFVHVENKSFNNLYKTTLIVNKMYNTNVNLDCMFEITTLLNISKQHTWIGASYWVCCQKQKIHK